MLGMVLLDVGTDLSQDRLCAKGREVSDLGFEGTGMCRSGLDHADAKLHHLVQGCASAFQSCRESAEFRVQSHAEQAVLLFPCSSAAFDESHGTHSDMRAQKKSRLRHEARAGM
jgi:hypothetical protein